MSKRRAFLSTAGLKRSPKPKPSSTAMATALAMRRFDAGLSDEQVRTIARAIDEATKLAAELNEGKNRLRNSDEPVTTFSAELP